MLINVSSIKDAGEVFSFGLENLWANSAVAQSMEGRPVGLSGQMELTSTSKGEVVSAVVNVDAEVLRFCDRCGDEMTLGVKTHASLRYNAADSTAQVEEEVELGDGDLNVGWFYEGKLDLSHVLEEAIALALPSRMACKDTSACNKRTESMIEKISDLPQSGHPAFAALKNLG